MWMRLIRSHGLEPGKSERVVDRYRQDDLPRIEHAPGFEGIAMGENHAGGSIGSVTFWSTRQDMLESEQLSAQARERAVPMFQVEDPMLVDRFEVAYSRALDPVVGTPKKPFMRIVRFRGLSAETVDQAAATYRDGAERHLPSTRGVFRIAIGVNHDAGTLVVVTFWVSERDMREASTVGEQVRVDAVSAAGVALTPLVDQFEVTVSSGMDHLAGQEEMPASVVAEPPEEQAAEASVAVAAPVTELPAPRPVQGTGVFARVTRHLGLGPDTLARTAQDIDGTHLPVMEAEPGFAGALVLADHVGGESISITLWDTEAAMLASERAAAGAREALQDGLAPRQRPTVLRCELVGHRPWTFDPDASPCARLNRHPGLTPEGVAARVQAIHERRLPTVEDEPGFSGAMVFTSISETQILSLSLWDSKEAMRRSEVASRGVRESLETGLTDWERVVVSRADVIASRHWADDRIQVHR